MLLNRLFLNKQLLLLFCAVLASCQPADPNFHGYVEGEFVRIAPTSGGLLQVISVSLGQKVEVGDPLFSLDLTELTAGRNKAAADVKRAQAERNDLTKGARPAEIEIILKQNRFNVQVPKGKIYGFLGPNGSGKTTTLRMMCGLLTPDEGEGTCLGLDIRTCATEIKRRIGYMTQKFSYWEDLSLRENLEFVARIYRLDRRKARVDLALERLNLKERQKQLAGQLSGGWKQCLALAACILHEPELLLLDEPTAGVDPKARREFWDEIHRLAAEGLTVLVSTHYMDEAERCHAIIYMSYGKLVTQGNVQDVIQGSGLSTWVVQGEGLMSLAGTLVNHPAVKTVAPFGDSLHVSGIDKVQLVEALKTYFDEPHLTWHEASPSFEDVFIRYMADAEDNFRQQEGGRT